MAPWIHERLRESRGREAKRRVADAIVHWFLDHGRHIIDTGRDLAAGGRAYLVGDDGAPWPLERDGLQVRLLLDQAGVNASEPVFQFVFEALTVAAYRDGRRIRLSRWQHSRDRRLYISCGPSHLVRVMNGALTKSPNGADDVWFSAPHCYSAWEPVAPFRPTDLPALNPYLEAPNEVPDYTREVQALLFEAWVAAC